MIKNPIQKVTNRLQYRAIGIVKGTYKPHDNNKLNRGILTDIKGEKIETVVLGKALSLIKKHINLDENYYWVVYPKNKNTQNLHLQITGVWDPNNFSTDEIEVPEKNTLNLLKKLDLTDNYFSIRGELVYVNIQKKEIVIKVCSSSEVKKLKNKNFKLVIEGELSLDILNKFLSLDVIRHGSTLRMESYEVIEKIQSKKQ